MRPSIFGLYLKEKVNTLPNSIKAHFLLSPDDPRKIVLEGQMREIWHRPKWLKPFLWVLSQKDMLFPETGTMIDLRLENIAYVTESGKNRMQWNRTFLFPNRTRFFNAVMEYDAERDIIVDLFGRKQEIEVDLKIEPWSEGEKKGLLIESYAYRMRVGRSKIKLPRWMAPKAVIYEWTEPSMGEEIMIDVRLHHPWIGHFFGYRGRFSIRSEAG